MRMVVQIFDPFYKDVVIDVNKPSSEKTASARSGNDQLEVGYDKSLGGESYGPSIW
jgi:hypothetical protein